MSRKSGGGNEGKRGDDDDQEEEEELRLLEDAQQDTRQAQLDFPTDDDGGGGDENEAALRRLERDLRTNQLRLSYARIGFAVQTRRQHTVTMYFVVEVAMLAVVLMSIWAPNAMPWTVTSFFTLPSMIGLIPVWLVWPLTVVQAQNFVHPRSPFIPAVFAYALMALLFLILELVLVIIQNVNVFGNGNALAMVDLQTLIGLVVSLLGVLVAGIFYMLGLVDEIDLVIFYGNNMRRTGQSNWYLRAEDSVRRRAAPITQRLGRWFGNPQTTRSISMQPMGGRAPPVPAPVAARPQPVSATRGDSGGGGKKRKPEVGYLSGAGGGH